MALVKDVAKAYFNIFKEPHLKLLNCLLPAIKLEVFNVQLKFEVPFLVMNQLYLSFSWGIGQQLVDD